LFFGNGGRLTWGGEAKGGLTLTRRVNSVEISKLSGEQLQEGPKVQQHLGEDLNPEEYEAITRE